ncbi:hypothetical protein R50073_14100 [Maricurvus nonylphenolicus]|uniref:hypothetical protein n=1 Tax=Maricurvus nonylphenolicus TaxID=1008307 RepID=UPI0036F375F3
MNELQRQQYLDALGVDTYMPRWVLPHAPEPVACDVSFIPSELEGSEGGGEGISAAVASQPAVNDSAATPVARPASTGAAPQGQASSSSVLAVLSGETPTADKVPAVETVAEVKDTSVPTATEQAKPQAASEPVPAFALSIWRISEDLLIIDSRQAQLALPTEPLLINILAALGYPRQPLPKTEVIRWPMVDNPFVGQSEADAREMLEAYLDGKLLTHPTKHLLLMGDEAARYILPAEQSLADVQGKAIELPQHKAEAIVVPSLSDMLQDPLQKRLTWQAIQPLVLSQE